MDQLEPPMGGGGGGAMSGIGGELAMDAAAGISKVKYFFDYRYTNNQQFMHTGSLL